MTMDDTGRSQSMDMSIEIFACFYSCHAGIWDAPVPPPFRGRDAAMRSRTVRYGAHAA
jgi:hypothetical protein